jgi:hypothetical protein
MREVTVEFIGICTNFRRSPTLDKLPAPHRVVLVDAANPPDIPQGKVLPHVPALFLIPPASENLEPIELFQGSLQGGATLTLQVDGRNVTGPVTYSSSFIDCLPQLSAYYPEYVPDPAVVIDGRARCYFDVHSGVISVFAFEGGERHVRLQVPVADEADVKIVVQSGDTTSEESVPKSYTLGLIMRTDPPGGDSDADFLLQYLTAVGGISPTITIWPGSDGSGNMPVCPSSEMLGTEAERIYRRLIGTDDLTTPACSNSGYP